MPKNWKTFLCDGASKTELFKLLSDEVIHCPLEDGNELYATYRRDVLCSVSKSDMTHLAPSTQEEADIHLFLHVADAVKKGKKNIAIRALDTDVVVVEVSSFSKIKADELWVYFGTRKHFRYIPIHDLVATLDPRRSCTLPIFHAITWWDTVSAFAGQGEKGLGNLASLPRNFRCVCGAYEHAKQAQ